MKLLKNLYVTPEYSDSNKAKLFDTLFLIFSGLFDLEYRLIKQYGESQLTVEAIKKRVLELQLGGSIIYFTPDQKKLAMLEHPLYEDLISLSQRNDEYSIRATKVLKEISHFQKVINKGTEAINIEFLNSVTVSSSNIDKSFICTINYKVPFANFNNRSNSYHGALELANKDLIKLSTDDELNIDSFIFQEESSNSDNFLENISS